MYTWYGIGVSELVWEISGMEMGACKWYGYGTVCGNSMGYGARAMDAGGYLVGRILSHMRMFDV